MRVQTKKAKQAVRVGDWVKTERGHVFEVVALRAVRQETLHPNDYGPLCVAESEQTALACALVEIRRR